MKYDNDRAVIKRAIERAIAEGKAILTTTDYESGRQQGYYEVLNILKNDLFVADICLRTHGLDVNLDVELT